MQKEPTFKEPTRKLPVPNWYDSWVTVYDRFIVETGVLGVSEGKRGAF